MKVGKDPGKIPRLYKAKGQESYDQSPSHA